MLNSITPRWKLCFHIRPAYDQGSYCPLLHPPYRVYRGQGSHACLILAVCAEETAADQSPGHGVYPPARISDGAFQLRMDNIWFCKLLLLFRIHTRTDTGLQFHNCAYVSVLEEYNNHRKPGHIMHILHILHILICFSTLTWLAQCQSTTVYERPEQAQVLYVIPVPSILGYLPLVPVGATGTISFAMCRETADFPGAFCDKSGNCGDGCRWWYVNSWALGWGTKQ